MDAPQVSNLTGEHALNLGLAIEECRKLKGVNKSQLAKDAGLSLPYLSQIIKGQREPSISILEKVSASLGIPSSLLIFLASEDSELSAISEETKRELRIISKQLIEKSTERAADTKIFG